MSRASNLAGFSTSISPPSNLSVGIVTATSFFGSGENLTGVGIGSTGNVNTSGIITATSFFGSGANLTGVGIGSTGSINTTGIITATSFFGSGSGLTGVGIGSTGSINTSGIITATSFVGSGSGNATGLSGSPNLNVGVLTATRLDVPPVPLTFSPAIGATGVSLSSNIIITFDQQVYKGTGNITLRANSAGGTAFSTIGVSSSSVSISGGAVTIDPPANIGSATTTFVVVDAGAFSGITTTSINALINTYSFTTLGFAFSSINPANAATNIGVGTNVTLTFNATPVRGTGTITLRSGSTSGSVIETFDAASSGQISISGNDWILDPTSDLGFSTSIHTIIPSTAIVGYVGLNTTGADTHSFTTVAESAPLRGSSYEGGFLICKASPLRWVVSPYSAEVGRTWYLRNDANTTAQSVSGCTGWFVPTFSQLQNPGYLCRSFWGPSPCFSSDRYYSSTEFTANRAYHMCFPDGNAGSRYKTNPYCVRAFRCVTY